MTLPTFVTARNEILDLFKAAWTSLSPAQNGGTVVPVDYGVMPFVPPKTTPYARVTIKHTDGGQRCFGATGARRFTRYGIVSIQVFTPTSKQTGFSQGENLAIIGRDAFEGIGTASGIWFRNVRIKEIDPAEGWYQQNVIAEFEYDELK